MERWKYPFFLKYSFQQIKHSYRKSTKIFCINKLTHELAQRDHTFIQVEKYIWSPFILLSSHFAWMKPLSWCLAPRLILPDFDLCMNGIVQYVLFFSDLFYLIFLKDSLTLLQVEIIQSFYCWVVSVEGKHCNVFTHSPVDRHLCHFQFEAIMIKAAIDILICTFWYIHRNWIAGS